MKVKVYDFPISIRKKVITVVSLLFGVLAFGTLGYMIIEKISFLDALYMTVITVATVGFKEIKESDDAGKVFTIILIFSGFGVFTYALTTGAQILVEGEIKDIFSARKAKALITVLSSDADNLYVVISARALNPNILIVARASGNEAKKKMKIAGTNRVICPYHIGVLRMAHTVLKPNVVDFWEFVTDPEHPTINVEEIRISEDSPMVGKNLKEIGIGRIYKVIVIGIRRKEGEFEFNPSADTIIKAGDILIVLGSSERLEIFRKEKKL